MHFYYTAPQTQFEELFGGHFCINAIGKIEFGDDKKFTEFLKVSKAPPRCVVYIDSTGGDVDTAIQIGRIIRGSWFSTDVGCYELDTERNIDVALIPRRKHPRKCLSAATLIYLGGRLRYLDDNATFGVHQFTFPLAQGDKVPKYFLAQSQTLSARLSEYISDMGISPQFLILSAATPSDEMQLVSKSELERLGVVTGGQTAVTWTLEANNGISYVKGERDSIYGHHKVMLCYKKDIGFYFHSVIETQNRSYELLNFGLVEIVLDGEKTRLDISEEVTRAEHGIYVNVVSRISEDEARQIAFSDSFGVQIRFSSEAEVFLGIAAMDTKNGQSKLRTFFENHKK
jgi:hypothetical protein